MFAETQPCPLCKRQNRKGALHAWSGIFPMYGIDVPTKGLECDTCGEQFFSRAEVRRNEDFAAEEFVDRGFETPAQFKFVRKRARISAVELAGLLDVAPETVSRWETGERPIPRLAAFALGELYRHPKLARVHLEALARPRQRVKIKRKRA